jgi:hypothetical protein
VHASPLGAWHGARTAAAAWRLAAVLSAAHVWQAAQAAHSMSDAGSPGCTHAACHCAHLRSAALVVWLAQNCDRLRTTAYALLLLAG